MDIFFIFHRVICESVQTLWPEISNEDWAFVVEAPHDPQHGDVATNAPLILARYLRSLPRDIGAALIEPLKSHPWVVSTTLAGAGFVNLTLKPEAWYQAMVPLLEHKQCYGHRPVDPERVVNVEYVSANPTGPLHVGHARGAVLGDTLARVLAVSGYRVIKEYYINDAGGQADQLARSVHRRYLEALGQDPGPYPHDAYPGEYLIPVGQEMAQKYGSRYVSPPEHEWLEVMRDEGITAMLALIRDDLEALGIHYDVWTSERALEDHGLVDEAIDRLKGFGHIYEGILDPPKGQEIEDWEPRTQMLFRSTTFGDDCDRPLKKSDGQWTYFARDIAYHYDKWKRGGVQQINVWGADHGGYVKRIQAALSVMTDNQAQLDVKICHIVTFVQEGRVLKMSKRSGTFASVKDLVQQVGADVVRFTMVSRKEGAPLECDLTKLVAQTKDNPVFYIQYAYARIHSVERQAAQLMSHILWDDQVLPKADLTLLCREAEWDIIKYLAQWPRVLSMTASAREPHRIAFYLLHLATLFHILWNQGKEQSILRFILQDQPDLTLARLTLNRMVAWVLENGMSLLGVSLRKEM